MGGVAGDGQNGGPVFHQHLRVPLHLGEGIVLAFAQNVGGAIRSGSPAGDHDVQVILITLGGGVLGEHLIEIHGAHGAEPTQNTQNGMFVLHGLIPRPFAQIGGQNSCRLQFIYYITFAPSIQLQGGGSRWGKCGGADTKNRGMPDTAPRGEVIQYIGLPSI